MIFHLFLEDMTTIMNGGWSVRKWSKRIHFTENFGVMLN